MTDDELAALHIYVGAVDARDRTGPGLMRRLKATRDWPRIAELWNEQEENERSATSLREAHEKLLARAEARKEKKRLQKDKTRDDAKHRAMLDAMTSGKRREYEEETDDEETDEEEDIE